MDIIYQTELFNNPTITPTDGIYAGKNYSFICEPLTIDQIVSLENTYNGGNPFPASLREVLYLAGQDCHVLDYGLTDTPQEMQELARKWLTRFGFSISRPFFVVDLYTGGDVFLFVYLDQGAEDPMVYQANLDSNLDPNYSWLSQIDTLSGLINDRIGYLKKGINPF